MDKDSIDLRYAYAQLGISPGAPLSDIQEVLFNATLYKFNTKSRINAIRQLTDFFIAREKLGGLNASFDVLKKNYHQKAMALHPDRNLGNKASEDALKEINAAYAIIQETYKQAREYYKESESFRQESENAAREQTHLERPHERKEQVQTDAMPKREKARHNYKFTQPSPGSAQKYMASYVPRSIRTARLSYLPLRAIIGSKIHKREKDVSLIFDYFMLSEVQFLRAKSYLASPEVILPALQYGKFTPPYTLKEIKEVFVGGDQKDPEEFAKNYFIKEFGL